jgi:elongation factor G
MKEYKAGDIRNVAVVGHGASGKTTLVDTLAFVSSSSKRHGTIKDGTTLTDHTPEEIERGYSINVSCAFAEWQGVKINLIDTPGYLDFQGDAIAGLAAADGALCLVSATAGVEVGTEKMFAAAIASNDPVLFVVSLMDKEHAHFERAYQQIKDRLTSKVVPVEVPIGAGMGFRGVINLFTRKAYVYKAGSRSGEYEETEIPESEQDNVERYYQELIEAISATDDAMLERYLEGGEIGRDEAIQGMKEAMKRGDLFPLFCVSADHMIGITALLTEIVQLMPSAFEMEELHAFKGAEGTKTVEIHAVDTNPFAALVFKTHSEPHIGDVSFFRVFSGRVVNGQEVFNATRDGVEKLGHLSVAQGKDRIEVPALCAGDIGCVAKLRNTHTNDTLSTKEHPVRLPQVRFPESLASSPCMRRPVTTRRSCSSACTGCMTRTPRSAPTTTPRRTRRSSPVSGSATSRWRWHASRENSACQRISDVPGLPIARRCWGRAKARGGTRSRPAVAGNSGTAGCE